MKLEIFRFLPKLEPLNKRFKRYVELVIKSSIMLLAPVPVSAAACYIWYQLFFKKEFVFSEKMEVIITAAWIPVFGLLYSLLAAMVLNTVWNEYKEIRKAVKAYDLEKFIDLRDEGNSTLINVLIGVVSIFVLGSFMALHYPDEKYGFVVIASTSYLLALILFVVKEIDDPCGGLWYIKSIPHEWLQIDPKKWRARRHNEERKKFVPRFVGFIEVAVVEAGPESTAPTQPPK